ncbi:hypothetical protein GCM10023093_25640 [Nemorincola caseinilytica]|uniref:PspC domain-containing protein n=1 Tax=Nemorincola caseinilytica TaxID=2054315 RepID=A0ABP8NJZ0_9BACT
MEKIININFQGRVIAIEETAYDHLKRYIDGLRGHFAKEESHEEIMNDIEDRIAELLSDRLKQGVPCIGMADVNAVMDSIGRLEDIAAADAEENPGQSQNQAHTSTPPPNSEDAWKGRLYRNGDDTLIAGVCSGLAARFGIDPTIVRILFVLLAGALFWVYVLLWILVPSRSLRSQSTRRFFRDREGKMIAGVCSGLAAYFGVDRWILRTIVVVPVAIAISSGDGFSMGWGHGFPGIFAGSVGGTLFILYAILWAVVPYAHSATERMEMRGERIDMNSIKAATQARAGEAVSAGRRAGRGFGRVIGTLFKAFFLLIAGCIALSLFGVLIALLFAGAAVLPFTNFIFYGEGQHTLAWVGIVLTLGIPLLAIVVWMIRRMMRVHTRRHYLGYVFTGLWLTGITCIIITAGTLARGFSTIGEVEDVYAIQQPSAGVLYIDVNKTGNNHHARHDRWFGEGANNDAPFRCISDDSLWLNNVRVNIEKSQDTLFHVYRTRTSRGNTGSEARQRAEHFGFDITQQDSVIGLADGFVISSRDKFRNQQVLVTVEVPVGKRIRMSEAVDNYSWYTINTRRQRNYERHWQDHDDIDTDTEYIMTEGGLKQPTDTAQTNVSIVQ